LAQGMAAGRSMFRGLRRALASHGHLPPRASLRTAIAGGASDCTHAAGEDPAGLLAARHFEPSPGLGEPATRLLIVWHSRTGMAEQMAAALERGARQAAQELEQEQDLAVDVRRAAAAQVEDLLQARGYVFCAPENLASVSGEMKEFFDRCYYGALGRLNGRPYALAISAGTDGEGAAKQVARICQGWRLKPCASPLVFRNGAQTPEAIAAAKACPAEARAKCEELGGLLAAQLLLGI